MRKGAQKNSSFSGGYRLLENNGVLNQSVVGAPFVSMLQTMYLGKGSQNFSRKTGKIFGIRARSFRKGSVVLTSVEIRSLEVV